MSSPSHIPDDPRTRRPLPGDPVSGDPVSGDPVSGDPVSGDPVSGDPVSGDPVSGTPVSVGSALDGPALGTDAGELVVGDAVNPETVESGVLGASRSPAGSSAVRGADAQALRRKAATISFLVGLGMFVMKTSGYLITNSAAILSDALESVVHVVATGIALYSIILIGRPADREHPYGYGKAEYFSAGVEGALIVIAAIAICYEAIGDLIRGSRLSSLDVGAWVVGTAGAVNLLLGFYLIRTGKKTNSLALVADGQHVLTDSYTSIGVLVGVLLVAITGVTILDPLFAIAVALNIVATGYRLVAESIRGLMNVADPETLERIVAVINKSRTPDMIDVHRLRAWNSGQRKFIDFHLALPYYFSLRQAHEVAEILHDAILGEFGGEAEVMIHLDACNDDCCTFCPKDDCDRRRSPIASARVLTVASAVGEPTHLTLRPRTRREMRATAADRP